MRQVPNVGRHRAAGADDAPHFGDGAAGVVNKDDHQRHYRDVKAGRGEGQGGGIAFVQLYVFAQAVAGMGEHRGRAVNAVQFRRGGTFGEQRGKGTTAAADIEPAQSGRQREPVKE